MRAPFHRKLRIVVVTVYATLYISIAAVYRVTIRRNYLRSYGDKIFNWWARTLIDVAKINCKVIDPHHLQIEPGKRYIVMCNHRSLYDIPLSVFSVPGSVRMLTKKELFRVPIWGQGLKVGEFVSIDRSNLEQAIKDLAEARKVMESGIVLWISPEGTRSRDGKLGPFKKGGFVMAIESGATIIPIGIQGSEKVLPPKTWDFHIDQDVEINIGEPIEASRYTMEEKGLLIEEVRKSIAELCGEATDEEPVHTIGSNLIGN